MPHGYLEIKKSMRKQHPQWSEDKIKEVASKTWNKNHPNNPVGRGEHKKTHKKGK